MSYEKMKPQLKKRLHTAWDPRRQEWMLYIDMDNPQRDKIAGMLPLPKGGEGIKEAIETNSTYQKVIADYIENAQAIVGEGADKVQQKGVNYYLSRYGLPIGGIVSVALTATFTTLSTLSTQAATCLQSLTGLAPNATNMFEQVTQTLMNTYNMTFNQSPLIDPRGPLAQQIYATIFNQTQELLTDYYQQQLQANQTLNQAQITAQSAIKSDYTIMASISGVALASILLIVGIRASKKIITERREKEAYGQILQKTMQRIPDITHELATKNYILEKLNKLFTKNIKAGDQDEKSCLLYLPLNAAVSEVPDSTDFVPYLFKDYLIAALDKADDLNVYNKVDETLKAILKTRELICNSFFEILKAQVAASDFYKQPGIAEKFKKYKIWKVNDIHAFFAKLAAFTIEGKYQLYTELTAGLISLLKERNQLLVLHHFVRLMQDNKPEDRGIYYSALMQLKKAIKDIDYDSSDQLSNLLNNLSGLTKSGEAQLMQYIAKGLGECNTKEKARAFVKELLELADNKTQLEAVVAGGGRNTRSNEENIIVEEEPDDELDDESLTPS